METVSTFPSTLVEDVVVGNLGPWGNLEHLRFTISPPVEFVEHYQFDLDLHGWRFPGCSREQVAELLLRCGMLPPAVNRLLESATTDVASQGITIFAPAAVVQELPASVREPLYTWLGQANDKSWHTNAFRYCGESLEEWFRGTTATDPMIELVRPYVYRHGPYWMFADLPAVAAQIADRKQLVRLIKLLAREATLLMKLHVRPGENIEPLVQYWGRGGRQKDVRPMLESLAHLRRGQAIDIVHLLPPFARRLLYTYPRPAHDGYDQLRDCHWSSLNFFADEHDDRLLNLNHVVDTIHRQWRRIETQPVLGDLVLFHDEHGNAFHSAIYIADDVLFTKNGPIVTRPWLLMPLSELRHFYPQQSAVQVKFFRKNELE